jgi:hypothetical protein
MTSSARSDDTASPPRAHNSDSIASESAWLTRHPNVTTAYFMFSYQLSAIGFRR